MIGSGCLYSNNTVNNKLHAPCDSHDLVSDDEEFVVGGNTRRKKKAMIPCPNR